MNHKLLTALFGFAAFASAQTTGVGNFIHVVANLDKSIEFYRDGIGLELTGDQASRPFVINGPVSNLYDAPGDLRFTVLKVPDSDMNVEVVEFKNFNSKPVTTRLQDPGATILTLAVRDLGAVLKRLKTTKPLVRDPDGFFVELVEGAAPANRFAMVVEDTAKTLRFYRDVFGLEAHKAEPARGEVHRSSVVVAGNFQIDFLEFKPADRKALHLAIHDPGASVLRLKVRDLDATAKSLTIVTSDRGIVTIGKNRITMARDLNNLFLEPLQPTP